MVVAGGVPAFFDAIDGIRHFLGQFSLEIAFSLLGDNFLDKSFPGFEVVAQVKTFKFLRFVFEYGFSADDSRRIGHSGGVCHVVAHVHENGIGLQFGGHVFDESVFEQDHFFFGNGEFDGVVGFVAYDVVEQGLGLHGVLFDCGMCYFRRICRMVCCRDCRVLSCGCVCFFRDVRNGVRA